MAVTFLPTQVLEKMASESAIKRLVTKDLTLNRAAVQSLSRTGVLSKKMTEKIALKVIKQYKAAYRAEIKAGASKSEALENVLNDKRLMVQRVQNSAVQEIAKEVRSQYRGERYEWLPSDAEEPDPLHQLNYGKKFTVGRGEMPGERPGCKCGMRILVDDDELFLEDDLDL